MQGFYSYSRSSLLDLMLERLHSVIYQAAAAKSPAHPALQLETDVGQIVSYCQFSAIDRFV
jgi:hypothetical protein